MDGYKVPKDQSTVLVGTPHSPPEEHYTFLSSCAEHHHGSETLSDLLARPKAFVPFLTKTGGPVLLRKDAIAWIRVMEPEKVEWLFYETRVGVPREHVRLTFGDGGELLGDLFAIAPEGKRRVSDLMNEGDGFIHLEAPDGLYLVNRRLVTAVHFGEVDRAGA